MDPVEVNDLMVYLFGENGNVLVDNVPIDDIETQSSQLDKEPNNLVSMSTIAENLWVEKDVEVIIKNDKVLNENHANLHLFYAMIKDEISFNHKTFIVTYIPNIFLNQDVDVDHLDVGGNERKAIEENCMVTKSIETTLTSARTFASAKINETERFKVLVKEVHGKNAQKVLVVLAVVVSENVNIVKQQPSNVVQEKHETID